MLEKTSEVKSSFQQFIGRMMNQGESKVKIIRSDDGGSISTMSSSYDPQRMRSIMEKVHYTINTPHQNEVAGMSYFLNYFF